jgi:hypothetical protein
VVTENSHSLLPATTEAEPIAHHESAYAELAAQNLSGEVDRGQGQQLALTREDGSEVEAQSRQQPQPLGQRGQSRRRRLVRLQYRQGVLCEQHHTRGNPESTGICECSVDQLLVALMDAIEFAEGNHAGHIQRDREGPMQHVHHLIASRPSWSGLVGILHPKSDFDSDLEVRHRALHDRAADAGNLVPVEVPKGFVGSTDGIVDGLLNTFGRGADHFGETVGSIRHKIIPFQGCVQTLTYLVGSWPK